MALEFQNTAEGGTAGANVTAGTTGGASGTPFGAIAIGAGSTVTFDNSQVASGSIAYKITLTNSVTYMLWTGVTPTTGRYVVETDVYLAALPAVGGQICLGALRNSTTNEGNVLLRAGGSLARRGASATIAASASPASTFVPGQWGRIAWAATAGTTTTNGRLEVAYYANRTDTAPAYTYDSRAPVNSGTPAVASVSIGTRGVTPPATANTIWYDNIRAGALTSGWFGPFGVQDLGTVSFDAVSTFSGDGLIALLGLGSATDAVTTTRSAILRAAPTASTAT